MKYAIIFALTLSSTVVFAKKSPGELRGNAQNTCVGCEMRAAQIDQENRRAGKELAEKRQQLQRQRSTGARTDV